MKRVQIGLLAIIMMVTSAVLAQDTSTETLPLSFSTYNINGVGPGFKLGIDYPLSEVIKQRVKRNSKTKKVSKLLYLNGSMAFAVEPLSNTNWLNSVEIARQRTRNDKWFVTPSLGLGAITRFNNGDSREVVDGEVIDLGITSRTYFAPSIGYTLGRNLSIRDSDYAAYTRINSVFIVGMNNTTVPLLSLEIGLKFTPSFTLSKSMHNIKKVTN
jgi:hypothetical protein